MKEVFIGFALICISICTILQCYSLYKKICCFLKYNTKKLCYKILQPDVKFLVSNIISIIFAFYIIYDAYDTYQLFLFYKIQDKSPDRMIIFCGIIIIVLALLSFISEFFPTIVTSKYVYWNSKRIYQKECMKYYYNDEKIYIYFDGKTLCMNREKKYDALLKILETNYKRQEKKIES